jgi:hypothetical protein
MRKLTKIERMDLAIDTLYEKLIQLENKNLTQEEVEKYTDTIQELEHFKLLIIQGIL